MSALACCWVVRVRGCLGVADFFESFQPRQPPAVALKQWLSQQRPELANEIFLDIDPASGCGLVTSGRASCFRAILAARRSSVCCRQAGWRQLSARPNTAPPKAWANRFCAPGWRISTTTDITSEWQRCDLFADGAQTEIEVAGGPPVRFNTAALFQLRRAIEGTGVGPQNFVWPPAEDPQRAPVSGVGAV